MTKRAEQVEQTRRRIVEAAVEVHGTLGPAAASISAIAERAGVTRLTVYRHFPDDEALFAACSAHWLAGQRPPDPAGWASIADPERRLSTGLGELYRFYAEGEPMLTSILRDKAALPATFRAAQEAGDAAIADLLAQPFDGPPERRRLIRALVGHAVSFWTWRSLCVDQRLTREDAVAAMTGLVMSS
ncbi:TetR/AcrR family transcriptional regulator [Jiangella anatolica]|uniref:TetR family transcriptional regulator n=1 Tax=Jiangella anatolica TaxID=2670374 RepID=A0A2W2C8V0_9ACTN|nr:TetR/AcrR family transcriptional regulator [Jiangella anatolica]PZF84579.1 TetR family transcriptional regulator [Jiangella anatolica]